MVTLDAVRLPRSRALQALGADAAQVQRLFHRVEQIVPARQRLGEAVGAAVLRVAATRRDVLVSLWKDGHVRTPEA